jgi:molecular chaperone DnaK (HSP70)
MVGDAVRTPIIQTVIKEVFGYEVSKTLLPDECIARGCTLYVSCSFNIRLL